MLITQGKILFFLILLKLYLPLQNSVAVQVFTETYKMNQVSLVNTTNTKVPTCPIGCICTPSPLASMALKSIVCTCRNDEIEMLTNFSIPLSGDYNKDENDSGNIYSHSQTTLNELIGQHLYFNASSFYLWTSVDRIVVHSCKQLTLHKNAFHGAKIIEQLKFVDIQHINVMTHAFAGIRRSPKQIIIQDAAIKTLASYAFTGLSNIDHFWWRNVTIEKIKKLTFFKVSNVGYLYYRDVQINEVEYCAFAHMRHIRHFFMRKKIRLGSVSDHIFVGAKIEELILEGVEMNTTDLSFVGVNAKSVKILNCRWNIHRSLLAPRRQIPVQRVVDFLVYNSSINRISLAYFYNFTTILFDESRIGELHSPTSLALKNRTEQTTLFIAFNIATIHFRRCHLSHWKSHALSGVYSIGALLFSNSGILSIWRSALYNARIDQIQITHTRIRSIGAHAFTLSTIDIMILERVEIGALGLSFLYKTRITGTLILQNIIVQSIDKRAFASITDCGHANIVHSEFAEFPHHGFENSKIKYLTINDSKFFGFFKASIFDRLDAFELNVINSEFFCVPTECEQNALLLHQTNHNNIPWKFVNNRCVKAPNILSFLKKKKSLYQEKKEDFLDSISFSFFSHSRKKKSTTELPPHIVTLENAKNLQVDESVCAKEFQTINEAENLGIMCRRRIFIEECMCVEQPNSAEKFTTSPYVELPSTRAKILLVGDCRRLTIEHMTANSVNQKLLTEVNNVRPLLEFLFLYRIDSLRVGSILDRSLKQLHLLYSNILFTETPSLISNNEQTNPAILINNSYNNFIGAELDEMRITGSIVKKISARAFAKHRRLSLLVFNKTVVYEINAQAFAQSNIGRVESWHSDFYTTGDMLVHVDEMRVEHSRITSTKLSMPYVPSKIFLTFYELCIFLSGKYKTPLTCKKCFKLDKCAPNYIQTNSRRNDSPIFKRCEGKINKKKTEKDLRDCKLLLAEQVPILSDVQVSLVSNAATSNIISMASQYLLTKYAAKLIFQILQNNILTAQLLN